MQDIDLIPRKQLHELQKWIDEPEALVILGPRQVGKTTLMKQLQKWLIQTRQIPNRQILSYNLDFEPDREKLKSQQTLINILNQQSKKTYIFIDEVQKLPEPGLFIKGLIDNYPQAKFILSGSSSLEIRSKVSEILTGRKYIVPLQPLSVHEVNHYTDYLYQLMGTGGYPAVYTTSETDKKQIRLQEIINSYLDKDIEQFLGIELKESYKKLLVLLADQLGELINLSRFSRKLNLHLQTVDRYLSVLQNTFIIDLVYPFSTKPSVEIVKSPVPYFLDLGIRNSLLNSFNPIDERSDKGKLFENLVYTELKNIVRKPLVINFWRTKMQNEVDFIITNRLKVLPVEAKFSELTQPEITTSMKSFIETYEPEIMIVVNTHLQAEKRWGSSVVKFRTFETFQREVLDFQW